MKIRFIVVGLMMTCLAIAVSGCDVLCAQLSSPSARYMQEGDRLIAADRPAEAILAYRQAVEQDARNTAALRKLARAYGEQGRKRLAQRYYQKALALEPGNAALAQEASSIAMPAPFAGAPKTMWRVLAGEDAPLGLVVSDGRVYVTLEGGRALALHSITGEPIWQIQLARLTSPPAVSGNQVLMGGHDGILYARAANDGGPVWQFATQAPIYAAATISGSWVYCASGDGTLYALNLSDGKLRWKFVTGGPLHGQPTVADSVVYFGSGDGRLYAVDAATGAARWQTGILTQGPVEGQPTVVGGRVFFGSGDSRLYALAVASGGEYWRYSTPDGVYARPLIVSDTIYAASAGGVLAALDFMSGEPRWELRTKTALHAPPVLGQDRLYFVAAGDPNLYAVDRSSGRVLWQMDTSDWLASGPVIAGNALYLAGKDGTVMALNVAR